MTYPTNSREVAFLPLAECREAFATLVRALDREDADGTFGPEGWRQRFTVVRDVKKPSWSARKIRQQKLGG